MFLLDFFLLAIIYFCVFAYFKWFKNKYTNNTIYTYIENYKNKKNQYIK